VTQTSLSEKNIGKGKLPDGWQLVRLAEVCEPIRGVTFQSSEAKYDAFEGSIPCLTTSSIQSKVNFESCRHIPRHLVKSNNQIIRTGDILVSTANCKALVGKSVLFEDIACVCTFGAFVTVLRHKNVILPEILVYLLKTKSAIDYFYSKSSNTTNISNLQVSELLEFKIPLPPLHEQKRIAAMLNEQMATVEKARVAADTELDAAKALRTAYLRSVFNSREAKCWSLATIGDVSSLIIDGPHVTPTYESSGIPFLTVRI
jgi:type I restriction enzyme S subunit